MLKYILAFIVFSSYAYSQTDIKDVLDFTISYRGMTRNDITIPLSFDPNKSPSTDTKLILPIVKELMKDPLKYDEVLEEIKKWRGYSTEDILEKLYEINGYLSYFHGVSRYPGFNSFEEFGNIIFIFIKEYNKSRERILSVYTEEEYEYLRKHLLSIIADSESEIENSNTDIFKYNEARDSSIKISKNVMELLNFLNRSDLWEASRWSIAFNVFFLKKNLDSILKLSSKSKPISIKNEHAEGNFYYYYNGDNIRIAIGDEGRNVYKGEFDVIIDIGGDDVYELSENINAYSCIIDISGNDNYTAATDFALAGGFFSSNFLFDYSGDDVYKGKSFSLGAAVCGLGVLVDSSGNDVYSSEYLSQAASVFGVGLLADHSGNDVYKAIAFSQGMGMTEGASLLLDNSGSDSYLADLRSLDIGRYEDHYISMTQGYAYGVRPYYAGGVGILLDASGNDLYYTDIFGQGGSYWYGLGILLDLSGHDKYNSYQYAQGSGIHLSFGILKDYDGWDSYISNGVSQGCGHDYGVGILHDVKGNDNYSAYSLSQGAGNANGIGILIDESGRDGYLSKDEFNTRGYGNPRRDFGSIGIFLDASGVDFYSKAGPDSVIDNSSTWGVFADYYLQDMESQFSGNKYKIELSGKTDYTPEEYFIMAKTIEPRFSKWSELGFQKLMEDSMKTASLFTTKLGTDDHRETSLMRNMIIKIPVSVSMVFSDKLKEYEKDPALFTDDELSMMAYLFGYTNNPIGRESLYKLTYNPNVKVRTNAINSLAKLQLDTGADKNFIEKTALRLSQLLSEGSDAKLYMKDIAFALNKYKSEILIPHLVRLMNYDYFPVRYLAATALQKYRGDYFSQIDGNLAEKLLSDKKWFQSFLVSVSPADENSFRFIYEIILNTKAADDEVLKLNIAEELKTKSESSNNAEFKKWAERNYKMLMENSNLKILK